MKILNIVRSIEIKHNAIIKKIANKVFKINLKKDSIISEASDACSFTIEIISPVLFSIIFLKSSKSIILNIESLRKKRETNKY